MDSEYKMVDFATYCNTCKYKDLGEEQDPCFECLDNPVNLYSKKPVKYEENGG